MPQIPGFGQRQRRSTSVPTREVSQSTNGVGEFLQNLGGKATQFGTELLAKRKRAEDVKDASERILNHSQDWMRAQGELKRATGEDGFIEASDAQELGINTDERIAYGDAAKQYWDESMDRFSQGAASNESLKMYKDQIRPMRNKNVLKADGETRKLKITHQTKMVQDQGNQLRNTLVTQNEVDFPSVLDSYRTLQQTIIQSEKSGYWGERTSKALLEEQKRKMATGMLNRFQQNGDGWGMIQFLQSGLDQVSSTKNKEGEVTTQGTIREKDLISKEQTRLREHLESIGIESPKELSERNPFGGIAEVAGMVNELSHDEVLEYLDNAQKHINSKKDYNARVLQRETQSLKRKMLRGDWDPVKNPEDKQSFRQVEQGILNVDPRSLPTKGFGLAELVVTMNMSSSVRRMKNMHPSEMQKQIDSFKEADLKEQVIDNYPEYFKRHKEYFKNNVVFDDIKNNAVESLKKQRKAVLAARQEDPAGFLQALSPAYAKMDAQNPESMQPDERIEAMESDFEALGMRGGRYVSNKEVENFTNAYTTASSIEAKAGVLRREKAKWGSEWLTVSREYLDAENIPNELIVAKYARTPEAMSEIVKAAEPGVKKAVDEDFKKTVEAPEAEQANMKITLNDSDIWNQFSSAMRNTETSAKSSKVVNAYRDTIMTKAKQFITQEGMDSDEAVERATNFVIGTGFSTATGDKGDVFIPKEAGINSDRVAQFLDTYSTAESLASIPKAVPGTVVEKDFQFTAEGGETVDISSGSKFKDVIQTIARELEGREPTQKDYIDAWNTYLEDHGRWATSKDMGGVILKVDTGGGVWEPVRTPEGGMVFKSWEDINVDQNVAEDMSSFGGR